MAWLESKQQLRTGPILWFWNLMLQRWTASPSAKELPTQNGADADNYADGKG